MLTPDCVYIYPSVHHKHPFLPQYLFKNSSEYKNKMLSFIKQQQVSQFKTV